MSLSKLLSKIEQPKEDKTNFEVVIPLIKLKDRVVSKDKKFTIKLRANPGDADSEKYEVTARPFDHGTPEEWLKHLLIGTAVTGWQGSG